MIDKTHGVTARCQRLPTPLTGLVAPTVERLPCKEEAVSSNPTESINMPSFTPEDFNILLTELDEFEISDEKEAQLQNHRDALNE